MSRENVDIVKRCLAARAGRGLYVSALDLIDPDVVVDLSARPDGGIHRGWRDAGNALVTWVNRWDDYSYEAEEFVDAGEQVVVLFRESGRGKESGATVEIVGATVWEVREGKVVRTKTYTDRREAFRSVGLPR